MNEQHTGEEGKKASGLDTNRGSEDVLMSYSVKHACVCSCRCARCKRVRDAGSRAS